MHGGPHLTRRLDVAAARWAGHCQGMDLGRAPDGPSATAATFSTSRAVFVAFETSCATTTSWATSAQINAYLECSQIRPLLRAITETKNIRSVPSRCARVAVLIRARFCPGRAASQGL